MVQRCRSSRALSAQDLKYRGVKVDRERRVTCERLLKGEVRNLELLQELLWYIPQPLPSQT